MIGDVVLINSGSRSSFLVDGDARLLREKDTISAKTANTSAKRLYLCVQTMYLKNAVPRYPTSYLGLLRDPHDTDPAACAAIDAVNDLVSGGMLYKALKEIRKLIKREEELLAA